MTRDLSLRNRERSMPSINYNPLKLSIVIPVYNEDQSIGEVITQVCSVDLGEIRKEIIICDDGSTDATSDIVRQHAQKAPEMIKTHVSPINLGKGAAVRLGMSYATGDIVIIQDADLELDPHEYLPIIQPIVSGRADVVYGSRFLKKSNKAPRRIRLANWLLTSLTNILFWSKLTDMETGYKAFRRQILSSFRLRCVRFDFEPEITARLLQAGYEIYEVPVTYSPRTEDKGKKISWIDGIEAVWTLVRCRFLDRV